MHIGKKVEKIRELKGLKQEALAAKMGVSQQTISRLEQSEHIEDDKLQHIADALEVTIEGIKAFNEDSLINNINSNHTFNDNSSLNNNLHCTFNPLDKLLEMVDENKKLYERLISEKELSNQLLQEVIEMYKGQLNAS